MPGSIPAIGRDPFAANDRAQTQMDQAGALFGQMYQAHLAKQAAIAQARNELAGKMGPALLQHGGGFADRFSTPGMVQAFSGSPIASVLPGLPNLANDQSTQGDLSAMAVTNMAPQLRLAEIAQKARPQGLAPTNVNEAVRGGEPVQFEKTQTEEEIKAASRVKAASLYSSNPQLLRYADPKTGQMRDFPTEGAMRDDQVRTGTPWQYVGPANVNRETNTAEQVRQGNTDAAQTPTVDADTSLAEQLTNAMTPQGVTSITTDGAGNFVFVMQDGTVMTRPIKEVRDILKKYSRGTNQP